jgi:hypothetical protein
MSKPLAFFAFAAISSLANAQSGPFDSFDCRPEVEIFRQQQREQKLREQARLDSLRQAEVAALAALAKEVTVIEDTVNGWRYWSFARNFDFGKDRGDLPMITALEALHPYFRDRIIQLIAMARAKGIELAVVESYRTRAKQAEYKSMGRKFTRSGAGSSKHQYGLAVDVVPIVNGQAEWHNIALWRKVGVMGERLGLRWGGRWRHPYDPGHFEWTSGLNSTELAHGLLPYVPKKEQHYPCLEADLHLLKKYWSEWEVMQSTLARRAK